MLFTNSPTTPVHFFELFPEHLQISATGKLRMFKMIFMFFTQKSIWHARNVPDVQSTRETFPLFSLPKKLRFCYCERKRFSFSFPQVAHLKTPNRVGRYRKQQIWILWARCDQILSLLRPMKNWKRFGENCARARCCATRSSPRWMFERLEESEIIFRSCAYQLKPISS